MYFKDCLTAITENKRSLFWQLYRQWWRRKLSLRQLTGDISNKKLSNWWPFVFSDWCNRKIVPMSMKWPWMIWIIFTGIHDDVIKWNHFPRYWPFVRRIHWLPVNSLHKGQWRGALMFSSICAWINGWVNNREAAIRQQAINRTSVDSDLCCHMASLVHAMACQLYGAKPLPEPMLTYHMILGIF